MNSRMILPVAFLLAAGLPGPGASGSAQPIEATLADVAFLAGHWTGGDPGDLSEEIWSAPEGDSMIGMWRYVGKGRARVFELLTLTTEGQNVILRLRHFDPKLVAREDKERAVELRLVAKGNGAAVFEGETHDGKGSLRLTYRRGDDGSLTSVLEKEGSKQEFRFRRR